MYKFLFGVLIAAVCFQPSFGQPVIKKTLPAVKKGLQNTLGNTQAVRAKAAFQNARKKPLRAAPKAPVHPSVPVAGGALPAYSLDINSLLSEEDRFIINNSAYFDKMPPAPRADMTAKEKYLHMRNKRVNALEKLVWAKRLDFVRKNIDPIADKAMIHPTGPMDALLAAVPVTATAAFCVASSDNLGNTFAIEDNIVEA